MCGVVAGVETGSLVCSARTAGQEKVVLVDEPRDREGSGGKATGGFLVRTSGAYELGGNVVAGCDVVAGFAGFAELEDPLGGYAANLWHAEAPERVDDDGGVWARWPPAEDDRRVVMSSMFVAVESSADTPRSNPAHRPAAFACRCMSLADASSSETRTATMAESGSP